MALKGHNPHLGVEEKVRRTATVHPQENIAPLDDPVDYETRFAGRVLELERAAAGVDDPEPVVDTVPYKNLRGEGKVGIEALTEVGVRPGGKPSKTWRP